MESANEPVKVSLKPLGMANQQQLQKKTGGGVMDHHKQPTEEDGAESSILHVLCVAFHHRNGPQVEYAFPPLPFHKDESHMHELPDEWSFMPFMCLPDGAHCKCRKNGTRIFKLTNEEFIYFHLPPIPNCPKFEKTTTFGLACFRQIDASELVNKTSDVTRTKVQKAVVLLSSQPILGSVRTKLGLVTQAYFAQKDFSKVDILNVLYESVNASCRSASFETLLYAGVSTRELVMKFKHRTVQLLKALLLGKRILFFSQKVERLCVFQYALVSLIPDLLSCLEDVGSSDLGYDDVITKQARVRAARRASSAKHKRDDSPNPSCHYMGFPLQVFGTGRFFQPYIPLQQMDVLMSPKTKSYIVGTSNAIFTQHRGIDADIIVNCETGNVDILKPELNQLLSLTVADKKFIDDIIKSVLDSWQENEDMSMNQALDFEGSDEDIRTRFEIYLTQMLISQSVEEIPLSDVATSDNNAPPPKNYLQDYNINFIRAWEKTTAFQTWNATQNILVDKDMTPGHPCHGYSPLGAAQQQIAAKISEWGKNIGPIQGNLTKAFSNAGSSVNDLVSSATEAITPPQHIQASATSLFSTMGNWYASKKKEWTVSSSTSNPSQSPSSPTALLPEQNRERSPSPSSRFISK